MEDNQIYIELPGYESSTIDTKNKTRKKVKELARSLANSNDPKDLLDYENGITKVTGNKARLFKRAYRKQDKQNKEYTAKLERDNAVIQSAKEGTLDPEQFGKWIATKRDESPITQKFVVPLIMGSAFGPAGAIVALSGESVNTGIKGASKGLYDTWGEWLTGGNKGWSIPAEFTNPGYLIAGPLAINKTGYTWRTGNGSTVRQNLQNAINQEIKDFTKGVKTIKLSDSVVDKNILAGKLGWSPSTTETLYHHSDKQLKELDPLFRSWDVTKRNAPLGKVWLTENQDIVELGGKRPFHYQTTVRLNKPMVQLNEAIQPGSKNNTRNQIISFAQESGADGIQFKNIADNKLLHQNQTAAFKPVKLQSEKVYELPKFAGGRVDTSDPNIRQQIIKAFKQRNPDFVEETPFEFVSGGDKYWQIGKLPTSYDLILHKDLIGRRLDKLSGNWTDRFGYFVDPETHSTTVRRGKDIFNALGKTDTNIVIPATAEGQNGGWFSLGGSRGGESFIQANAWRIKPARFTQLHESISHPMDAFIGNVKSDLSDMSIKELYTRISQPKDLFPNYKDVLHRESLGWVEARSTNNEMIKRINEIISKETGKSLSEVYADSSLLEKFVDTKLKDDQSLIKFMDSMDSGYLSDYAKLLKENAGTPEAKQYANRIRAMIKTLPIFTGAAVGLNNLNTK